jgi:hypothetical protein
LAQFVDLKQPNYNLLINNAVVSGLAGLSFRHFSIMPMSDLQLPTPISTPIALNGRDQEFICSEGYSENEFEGKLEQMEEVVKYITEKGFLPDNLIENEVLWFYK